MSWWCNAELSKRTCSRSQGAGMLEYFCRPAGVLGGVGMAQTSSMGGTANTTGLEPLASRLISRTWMGDELLRRFTWYRFCPVRVCGVKER